MLPVYKKGVGCILNINIYIFARGCKNIINNMQQWIDFSQRFKSEREFQMQRQMRRTGK